MLVVLDSTVFVEANFHLEAPNLKRLVAAAGRLDMQIVVPKLVIREVERKYCDLLRERVKAVRKVARALNSHYLRPKATIPGADLVEGACAAFEKHFEKWRQTGMCLEPAIADVSVTALVDRDLARRKPFSDSGKGMRDSIIWEGVLAIAKQETDDVVLVSNNVRDFGNATEDGVDAGLVEEFQKQTARNVTLSRSLREFSNLHIRPHLAKIAVEAIKDHDVDEFNAFMVFANHQDEVKASLESALAETVPGELESPSVSDDYEPEDVEIVEALALPGNLVEVQLRASATVLCDFYVFKSDVIGLQEELGISIAEWDHNDHYSWVQLDADAEVTITVTVDAETFEETGFQVDEVCWTTFVPKDM